MSSRGVSQERALSQERDRETPFAGYGDRVGSGVMMAPSKWKGGEFVADPTYVTKSLKPRRMFYSPIGDGVVAADGVELKRSEQDLTPKVEVTNQRIVEKGDRGMAGLKVQEKTWTTGGGGEFNANAYGNQNRPSGPESGPGDGRNSAGISPVPKGDQRPIAVASQPAPPKSNLDNNLPRNLANAAPPPQQSPPAAAQRPASDLGKNQYRSESATLPDQGKSPTNGYGGGYPTSGRTSATSALYEPGYRYEIKRDYQVTNPKELIHQYATTTPVTVIDPTIETTTRTITKQRFSQTIEEFGPFPPYTAGSSTPSPLKFARDLRDQTMTESQRRANQSATPTSTNMDSQYEQRIREMSRSTSRTGPPGEIDQLADKLASGLGSTRR